MPPISSLGSAPRMIFNSPAASISAIQLRRSLLATVILPYCYRSGRMRRVFPPVVAGLVPATPIVFAWCVHFRGRRDKPGDDAVLMIQSDRDPRYAALGNTFSELSASRA